MFLSGQSIRAFRPVEPFEERTVVHGMSRGLSVAGYDIAIAQDLIIYPHEFKLASAIEQFNMPPHIIGFVHDKSTWARKGLAVQNTVVEPGWKGFLTLELTNHGYETLHIEQGMPIAQVVFAFLDQEAETPYSGKYQNQEAGPQGARFEKFIS